MCVYMCVCMCVCMCVNMCVCMGVCMGVVRNPLESRTYVFFTNFRRTSTANAEGLYQIGGWRQKALGETRL